MRVARGCRGWLVACALILIGFSLAEPAEGQNRAYLTVGRAFYSAGPFCLDSNALITTYRTGLNLRRVGVSVAYLNNQYPWPERRSIDEGAYFLTRGSTWQGVVEVYPLALFTPADAPAPLGGIVRPFVGVGLQRTGDADGPEAGNGEVPTFALEGSTDVLATYGVGLHVPLAGPSLGLQVQLRGTTAFPSEFVLQEPGNVTSTRDDPTLTWGEISVGLSVTR